MTLQTAIALLENAQTGHELLNVLDNLQGGFKYIESPMIEQVLGVATIEPIEFWWYNQNAQRFTTNCNEPNHTLCYRNRPTDAVDLCHCSW